MTLTPLDLKKQEFDRVFRGYDPVAVDAFLDLAAEEMGNLVTRVNALEERLRNLAETVDDYRQMEQALKDTMLSAQRLADEARDASARDGELIRKEARLEADQILAEAERRRAALEQRIADLEGRERSFIRKMKSFLDEHRQALETHPLGSPPFEVRDVRGAKHE
jgi:cell division initiation protein